MLIWIVLAYALLVLGGCAFQRKLLYFPQTLPLDTARQAALKSGFETWLSPARAHMPLLLPSLTLQDRYDPAAWLKDYRGPIQFVIAGEDEIIPPKFGHKLHEDYQGPKRLLVVPDAGHNEVAGQPAEWWNDVYEFWKEQRSQP